MLATVWGGALYIVAVDVAVVVVAEEEEKVVVVVELEAQVPRPSTSFLPCRSRCCRSSTAESELISGLISGPIPREGPEPPLPPCSKSELIIGSEQSVYNIFDGLGGFSIMGDVRFIPAEYFSALMCGVCTS